MREPAHIGPAEAAILETFVAPRYLELYSSVALEMLAVSEEAQLAHLHCRTGYPQQAIAAALRGVHIYGADPFEATIELARAKLNASKELVGEYVVAPSYPLPFPEASFSHAIAIAPPVAMQESRWRLLNEFARLLAPNAQAVLALPLRDSYQEIIDFLREYALKYDANDVTRAIEQLSARPTIEALHSEFEAAGFDFVETKSVSRSLSFANGRAFFEDPAVRFCILPDLALHHSIASPERPMAYAKEAIDKYFSDRPFELTLHIGCITGRRR